MNVTIEDAINAFALLRDSVNENGFLYECYNLGISALKTIQDGNYIIEQENVSRETLEKIVNYDCSDIQCADCDYFTAEYGCLSKKCKVLLHKKEIEQWIITHYQN